MARSPLGRRAPVVLALLAALLAGCNSGEKPVPGPTPSSTPTTESAAASPSPSGTPTPKRETVREFLNRWAEIDREMQNTGDTAAFRRLSDGCEACDDYANRIEKIYKAGGHVESEGWQVVRVDSVSDFQGAKSVVHIRQSGSTTLVESPGSSPQHLTGGEVKMRAELERRGQSWKIRYLAQVSS